MTNAQPPEPFNLPSPQNARSLLITASFGYILPDSFLDLFYRTHKLNVHPSLLPRWRGAAPIQWTIANGDETTGVSVQRLVSKAKGIDAGKLVGVADGIVSLLPDA
jgi:methionyl-tRNA formyltransferase